MALRILLNDGDGRRHTREPLVNIAERRRAPRQSVERLFNLVSSGQHLGSAEELVRRSQIMRDNLNNLVGTA